jgi:hypothetical protein
MMMQLPFNFSQVALYPSLISCSTERKEQQNKMILLLLLSFVRDGNIIEEN